jgi:hypothetical protein
VEDLALADGALLEVHVVAVTRAGQDVGVGELALHGTPGLALGRLAVGDARAGGARLLARLDRHD